MAAACHCSPDIIFQQSRAGVQWIIVTSYLVTNIYVLSGKCRWFTGVVSINGEILYAPYIAFGRLQHNWK